VYYRPTAQYEAEALKQDYLQIKVLEVAPQVYAAGQLFESDLKLIAGQKVRSIINTWVEDEASGRSMDGFAKAAEEYGIQFVEVPVDPASISEEAAQAFWATCEELQRPLIVCSRSGALSTKIWETAEAAASQ
jgi:uncharacterized protein (TIGR01244 family)